MISPLSLSKQIYPLSFRISADLSSLNRSLVAYRRMLRELVEGNATRITQLDSRISVQQDTLSRFSLQIRAAVHDQKVVLYTLHNSENRLRAEVEHESFLLGELASLQTKVSGTLNCLYMCLR
jgi:uncharacterized coiled-coil protein SlyX